MQTWQQRINISSFLVLVFVMNAEILIGSQSGRHTYVVRYKHGESLIPVTVVLDYKRQTEYVINMNSRSPAKSITLYDFKERVIVYKDLKNGECFVGRLIHETIQEEDAILKRLKNPVESEPLILTLEPDRPSLTPTEVRNLAGHKAAVFCRRMNTWKLMPEKENKRAKRDVSSSNVDRSVRYDDYHNFKHFPSQRNRISRSELHNRHTNESHRRNFHSLQSNGSFPAPEHIISHPEIIAPGESTVLSQEQKLKSVYPYILPRQRAVAAKKNDRKTPVENRKNYNATGNTEDGNSHHFVFAHGTSTGQVQSHFIHPRPSDVGDGIPLSSPTKHTFYPVRTNSPVISPSISHNGTFSEGRYSGNNTVSQIYSPTEYPGGYPQNGNGYHSLYGRGQTVDNFSSLHQLPAEAFVLPLTRSSTGTTPQFEFSNRLGYELVDSKSPGPFTDSDILTGDLSNKSLTTESRSSVSHLQPLSNNALDSHHFPANNIRSVNPLHFNNHTRKKDNKASVSAKKGPDHRRENYNVIPYTSQVPSVPTDRFSNEIANNSGDARDSSSSDRFDNADSFSSTDNRDTPIEVPRWYSEVTKQISIPLEIEVLDHREEYTHHVSNRTEEVNHSAKTHEAEDLPSVPTPSTVFPIPVESLPNGKRSGNELKLLPLVSSFPNVEYFSRNASNRFSNRQNGKTDRQFVHLEFKESTYPNYKDTNNISLHETVSVTGPTLSPVPITHSTKTKDFVGRTDFVPASSFRQKAESQVSSPTPSYKVTSEGNRWTPARQQNIDDSTFGVHDVTIDEGLPSYRKRFPAVSQLFIPEETIADVSRLPDRGLRPSQQNPHASRRRPSVGRNRTRGTPHVVPQPISQLKKQDVGSRSFISREQTRLTDQGITFHHRGYAKARVPGDPYSHHRKRLDVLPPGVSVHPRHPQAPYADLATDTVDKTMPVNPMLHPRPRRIHPRHHRRHQRKRNHIAPSSEQGIPVANCCGVSDVSHCCSNRRSRGRHFFKAGCCTHQKEGRGPNLVLRPETVKNEVSSRKKVEDVTENRCFKEKMCRTVYQSTKKVLVCRNIAVEGC